MPVLVIVSDTHGQHKKLKVPPGDVFVHAGDVSMRGELKSFISYNNYLGSLPHRHKITIDGNHDGLSIDDFYFEQQILSNSIYLRNSGVVIDDLLFWGSPITPEYGNWNYMGKPGQEMKNHWAKIPENTDVLITHGPAYGIGDWVPPSSDSKEDYGHKGCQQLLERIYEIRPKVHICGHIHEGYGIREENGIIFVNAAVLNAKHDLVNEPIVLSI